ncbi:hypothetical protein OHO83_09535 [Streptomyces sp. NBC_00569]|uniref:hypothetical protein n=1 Tax=Streptomyces sp. NBC_00569 TaxID=2975780 RepID=UPI002E8070DE|nr:hypothetical protein [Streptomyces sp. NBC_00569]WUB92530.1 hypothetical protein OHO83_09535 [Streptomyces sp. NBC_00569]
MPRPPRPRHIADCAPHGRVQPPGELPVVDEAGKALATYIVSTQPVPEVRVGYLQIRP